MNAQAMAIETRSRTAPLRVLAAPQASAQETAQRLIAASPALLEVVHKAERVAVSNFPVLIQGESGSGKELLGALIHDFSPRRQRRFIKVNCAAFSDSLAESEFFGHEKGAFTGADQRHLGFFERADGSSLLLDEIGEMPLRLQAKLLRVLEEGVFERVGGEEPVRVDVRIVATTNRDLEQEVAEGSFRRDLFYRLNSIQLRLPPLRERPQDIPLLVKHFIERFGDQGRQCVGGIAPAALELLLAYSWPGNVRQLRNVLQHACVLAESDCIQPGDLPPLTPALSGVVGGKHLTLAEMERQLIMEALRDLGGSRKAAAQRLGIHVRTLQNKLKEFREDLPESS